MSTVRLSADVPVELAPLLIGLAQAQGISTSRALGAFLSSHRREVESLIEAHRQARAIASGEGLPLLRVV
ncbi:MAG: hypothetical protein IH616_24205 [Gemmatimonadales bacterium]|nr:hypothetical protein [Gemmatimonadales bacterium]